MGLGKKVARVGAGLMTGGLSEVAIRSGMFKGMGGGSAPERQTAELDAGTKELMAQQSAQAMKSPDEIAAEQMQGTEQLAGGESEGAQNLIAEKSSALGGVMPQDFDKALRNRAKGFIDKNQLALKSEAKMKAGDIKAQRMGQLAQYEGQLHAQLTNKKIAAIQAASAKKAARAKMIGAIGGAVGAVAGTLIAPGVGTAAGAQIGSSLGGGAA